jgi:phage terminase large subunit-like protein
MSGLLALTEEEEYDLAQLIEMDAELEKYGGCFTKFFITAKERSRYKHWIDAFNAGKAYRQRMALCANQVGKTTFGLFEVTCHATGLYPDWWEGFRFDSANDWWIGGEDTKSVKEALQDRLLGQVGEFGTGFIPRDCIDFESMPDIKKIETPITSFRVRHVSGGYSTISFKTYEQGRKSWQARPGISILLDEEPPIAIYTEALMRTVAGEGRVLLTFTPLRGVSDTVMNFLGDEDILHPTGEVAPGRYLIRASWDEAPHLTEEAKNALLASIPKFQRDARTKGIPTLGAGAIFQVPETTVFIDTFPIPRHWKKAYGLDVGWNRTAAVWGAINPEDGVLYIYGEHYLGEATPLVHSAAIKARGAWIPGCIDPASRGRGQDDGQKLFDQYIEQGLVLEKAENWVEGPLWEIQEAMEQGRFKIFNTCANILSEFRLYRRDERGKIVKKNDHAMDAMRYLWNTGRHIAISEPRLVSADFMPTHRPRL